MTSQELCERVQKCCILMITKSICCSFMWLAEWIIKRGASSWLNSTGIVKLAKLALACTAVMIYELIHYVLLITLERWEQLKLTMTCDFLVVLEYTQLDEFEFILKNFCLRKRESCISNNCLKWLSKCMPCALE